MPTEIKVSYKDTLNLPRTDFPIRPKAKEDDPTLLKRWDSEQLYQKAGEANQGAHQYVLHDGPPYANGHIHLGHAYNYVLKDLVSKSARMSGKHVRVIPGWDCHGLPIELKVSSEHPNASRAELKKACRTYAQKWVDIQGKEFKNLGVIMDWQSPYLTMSYDYEASVIRAFGVFVEKGYIQRKEKTVPWCASCQTVLATAEIEYEDRKDPSLYVAFELTAASSAQFKFFDGSKPVSLLIWTTTPWTLPLNRAVLAHPQAEYSVLDDGNQLIIIGSKLVDAWCEQTETKKNVITTIKASQLEGMYAHHPFEAERTVPLLFEDWVGTDEGTAFVHCAPGCGPQDYEVGVKNNLEIFSPVATDGSYTQGVGIDQLIGVSVKDVHGWVIKQLLERGKLLHKTSIKHSYPHCWRCRNGLLFRATRQWFCSLEHNNLRGRALEAIEHMQFLPPRSKNYLKATVGGRLEWCISRQRVWGSSIPALLCSSCDEAYVKPEMIERVAQGIEQEGIEFWDRISIQDLMPEGVVCTGCNGTKFKKEQDILDVWFDSGVSNWAVLAKEKQFPADMYLEGLDQHRGWFQSSLLCSLVLNETTPTQSILTHGFTVDDKGQKMSKSRGNVVVPQQMVDRLGTDGLRLWVASIDYEGDVVVSESLLDNVSQVYRKIRNTCRFLLANLYDYSHENDALPFDELQVIDQYALLEADRINQYVQRLYKEANFTGVFHALSDYAAVELSQFYIAIVRDRLYVEQADGQARRSAQTACYVILDTLTKLMAPILSFTAELVSDEYQKNKTRSIHLERFAQFSDISKQVALLYGSVLPAEVGETSWQTHSGIEISRQSIEHSVFAQQWEGQWHLLRSVRDAVMKAVEHKREEGVVKDALEARVTVCFDFDQEARQLFERFQALLEKTGQPLESFLKEFFIASQVKVKHLQTDLEHSDLQGLYIGVEKAHGSKCPRCWQWSTAEHENDLCERCFEIVG